MVAAAVDDRDNNQCPNCGHRFSPMQMLFWGMGKTSSCPDCKCELGVNKDRILLLWVIGILAIVALRLNVDLDSPSGWIVLGVFIIVFALMATRVQKLETRK